MDKAIIFGIYEFVNFHICKALLNKGVEVKGIHIDEPAEDSILEDQRLEVGRNANFIEQTLSQWGSSPGVDGTNTAVIFSIYDLYMLKKENILQEDKVMKPMVHYLDRHNNDLDIILLLPIQFLQSKQKDVTEFVNQLKEWGRNTYLFYLPAIYGPGQPKVFLFQQAILSEFQQLGIIKADREWTGDVLFIEDALETIFETIETEKPGEYVIESGEENYWGRLCAYLNLNEEAARSNCLEPTYLNNDIVKVQVKKAADMEDSILKQINHVKRLYQNG